jgi:hypothetical protein
MSSLDIALTQVKDPVERLLRVAALFGGATMAMGALLRWIETTTFAGPIYQSGLRSFAGKVVLVIGLATIALVLFRIPLELAFVVGGAAGVVQLAWLIGNFEAFSRAPIPDYDVTPAIGFGISLLGTALATLAGFAQLLRRRVRPAGKQPQSTSGKTPYEGRNAEVDAPCNLGEPGLSPAVGSPGDPTD